MAAYANPRRRTWEATGTFPMWVVWTLVLAAAIVLVTGPLQAPWHQLLLRAHAELVLGRAKALAPLHGARDALNQASAAIAGH